LGTNADGESTVEEENLAREKRGGVFVLAED
jgi:hypothetical protein